MDVLGLGIGTPVWGYGLAGRPVTWPADGGGRARSSPAGPMGEPAAEPPSRSCRRDAPLAFSHNGIPSDGGCAIGPHLHGRPSMRPTTGAGAVVHRTGARRPTSSHNPRFTGMRVAHGASRRQEEMAVGSRFTIGHAGDDRARHHRRPGQRDWTTARPYPQPECRSQAETSCTSRHGQDRRRRRGIDPRPQLPGTASVGRTWGWRSVGDRLPEQGNGAARNRPADELTGSHCLTASATARPRRAQRREEPTPVVIHPSGSADRQPNASVSCASWSPDAEVS